MSHTELPAAEPSVLEDALAADEHIGHAYTTDKAAYLREKLEEQERTHGE